MRRLSSLWRSGRISKVAGEGRGGGAFWAVAPGVGAPVVGNEAFMEVWGVVG